MYLLYIIVLLIKINHFDYYIKNMHNIDLMGGFKMENNLTRDLLFYCNVSVPGCEAITPHITHYYDLTFVLSGSLTYFLDGEKIVINKNDAMLARPNTLRQRLNGNTPVSYVNFNFIPNDETVLPNKILLKNIISPTIKHIVSAIPQKRLSPFFYSKEKLTNILNYILFELIDNESLRSHNSYIIEIIKYINENINKPLTLSDISKHVHLTNEYTSRLFKKEMGDTITDFIHKNKMKIAKDMIFSEKTDLNEIALQLGYQNYSYFSRTFKKYFQYSPAEYKKKTRLTHTIPGSASPD